MRDLARRWSFMRNAIAVVLFLLFTVPAPADEKGDDALRDALRDLIAARDYKEALKRADAAIAENPDSALAMQYRAYALHQLGRKTEARRAYEKTVELAPENWWAHMNLGSLLASMNRWDEALTAATRATDLKPDSKDAWRRLVRILRDRLLFEKARAAVMKALAKGIEPAWCHAQLAELSWIENDREAARKHWDRSEALGFDARAVAHGRRLVTWDEEIKRPEPPAPAVDWVFSLGRIEVRTQVGPKLPREIAAVIQRIQKDHEKLLGVRGKWPFTVRLVLSRTVEAHEVHRRREYYQGHRGGAFHLDRRWRGRGRFGRRGTAPATGRFEIYVAWSEPDIERRLSHEILHSVLRMRIPNSTDLPMWLDEGLATYVELTPDRRGRLQPGAPRVDLLESLAVAQEANVLPSVGRFIRVQYREFHGRDSRAYYAKAWALVHFLLEKRGGRRRLGQYLDALDKPRARTTAEFEQVYGSDLDALETAWWEHVLSMLPE